MTEEIDDCKYETDVAFPLQFIGSKKAQKKSRARGNSSLDAKLQADTADLDSHEFQYRRYKDESPFTRRILYP